MPRSRVSEMPQRLASRGTHPLRTSSSDSDPLHHRSVTDRSPKLGDRRSPRGTHPDSISQKKLGTRIADLESQLGQAQQELKILKNQLASAEAAKKEAQQELEKKTEKPTLREPEEIQDKHPPQEVHGVKKIDNIVADDVSDDNQHGTDVFEVQVQKEIDIDHRICQVDSGDSTLQIVTEPVANSDQGKSLFNDLALKDDQISELKAKLDEKENKLEVFVKENQNLKNLLYEATSNISSAKVKEEEMSLKLSKLVEELEGSEANAAVLKKELEKLEAAEGAKEALEAEIKTMRVQTEQWRKAADAAATVLAGAVEMNGRITTERCGSMDKHFGGVFETPGGGYSSGFVGSPGMADDLDDGFGTVKRKGSGIKKFGDLWRKKGQK